MLVQAENMFWWKLIQIEIQKSERWFFTAYE
jgi:hypothetical protein